MFHILTGNYAQTLACVIHDPRSKTVFAKTPGPLRHDSAHERWPASPFQRYAAALRVTVGDITVIDTRYLCWTPLFVSNYTRGKLGSVRDSRLTVLSSGN